MKPGDLRRFKDDLVALTWEENCRGHVFTVLNVGVVKGGPLLVDILVDGRLEKELGYHWVLTNSEALNEAR